MLGTVFIHHIVVGLLPETGQGALSKIQRAVCQFSDSAVAAVLIRQDVRIACTGILTQPDDKIGTPVIIGHTTEIGVFLSLLCQGSIDHILGNVIRFLKAVGRCGSRYNQYTRQQYDT